MSNYNKKVSLECSACKKIFLRSAYLINPDQQKVFCSRPCMKKERTPEEKTKMHTARVTLWRKDNREKYLETRKKNRIKNAEKGKIYRKNNAEKLRESSRSWKSKNRKRVNENAKKYRERNKARHMLIRKRMECKKSGIEFDMTEEWFQKRLDSGVCEMTGFPFDMIGKRTANSPSIDRIDPNGPYSMANCRLIIWSLNRALSNYGENYFIEVCKALLNKRGIIC